MTKNAYIIIMQQTREIVAEKSFLRVLSCKLINILPRKLRDRSHKCDF